jgi:hypothetical protein
MILSSYDSSHGLYVNDRAGCRAKCTAHDLRLLVAKRNHPEKYRPQVANWRSRREIRDVVRIVSGTHLNNFGYWRSFESSHELLEVARYGGSVSPFAVDVLDGLPHLSNRGSSDFACD